MGVEHMTTVKGRTEVARYRYLTADGALAFEVVRYHPKMFEVQDRNRRIVEDWKNLTLVPYRLPELIAADAGQTVYVVEGEKDVDNLRSLGLVATTNLGGCRLGWRPEYSEYLRGRHVVILPDADGPGQRLSTAISQALADIARSVVILNLPGLHGPDDVSDWLARGKGNDVDRLLQLTVKARYGAAGLTRSPSRPDKVGLILESALNTSVKLLLLTMCHVGHHDGARHLDFVKISMSELGRFASMHRVQAQRLVSRLREEGILRRDGSGHVIAWDVVAVCRPAANIRHVDSTESQPSPAAFDPSLSIAALQKQREEKRRRRRR
jgi:hypothetical protein